jgi:hypothetical protein
MGLRQVALGLADGMGHRRAFGHIAASFQRRPEQGARLFIIGKGQAGARAGNILAIGLDKAASTPSSEVPLIRPMTSTHFLLTMCRTFMLFPRSHPSPPSTSSG